MLHITRQSITALNFLTEMDFKLSDDEELKIESLFDLKEEIERPVHGSIGRMLRSPA